MIALVYLLLLSPLITHLIVDYRGTVLHWLNAIYVTAIAVSIGFILGWEGAVYSLCIHFSLFDPFYNWMHGHRWNYHGNAPEDKKAWTDKQWEKLNYLEESFVRIFALILGIALYHYSHLL
jgi:hypothetical protein